MRQETASMTAPGEQTRAQDTPVPAASPAVAQPGSAAGLPPLLSGPPAGAPPLPGQSSAPLPPGSLAARLAPLATDAPQNAEAGPSVTSETGTNAPKGTGRRAAKRRAAGPARGAIAANDDIPTIGALIYALEQKPSRRPFQIAVYASIAWLAVGVGFTWVLLASEIGKAPLLDILTRPAMMVLVASLVLPIAIFWFLAMLVWRAQELKLMSSAMTEVAVRLAEPDRAAEQSVTSLGQTVRKQVNFMNDAVAQAIGRAGELEAMVHSEVTNLERSFQENESRIRGVLAELASERSQLVATSGDVHATLRAMGDEVPALIEKLNGQQGKLARIIESAGQNLIALEGSLLKASDRLEGSLVTVSDKLGGTLLTATDKIETALSDRTGHLQQVLDEYTGAINMALGNRTNQMQTVFEDYTRALDSTLVERTRALDGAFAERVRLFDESILRSTSTIDSVVGEKAVALTAAMQNHARQLADTLGRQSENIDETLMHGIDAVRRSSENITKQSVKAIEGLSGQADMLRNVSENLLTQIGSVTNRFENQGQSIMRAANALETANFRIDTTLQQRHRELGDTLEKLTGKAGEIDAVMQSYTSNLEGSMSAAEGRARSLTGELSRNAEAHARTTLADIERMRAETEAQATRTLTDMHSQFSTVGREMSNQMGSLSSRLTETSEDLRLKTQRAANELMAEQERLRAEAERIPVAAREGTDAMRRALNDQIRALDQLTSMSARETARRDVTPPAPLYSSGPPPAQAQQAFRAPASLPPPASLSAAYMAEPAASAGVSRWSLGDLLARASTTPEPPPAVRQPVLAAAHAPGVAATINLEAIASALDAETAAAIWARLRGGQRGILVRSIYSTEGRSIFDEVVRKYVAEPAFRSTVDRFLTDFERLLRDSEARDVSGRAAEEHLASAGGRTYLFLSHASGRMN